MHFGDIGRPEADAREPLALFVDHGADTLRGLTVAFGRHQLQRRILKREQCAGGTIAGVFPGRRLRKQRLVGRDALLYISNENDDVIEPADHGKSPRVFLAARTFSTPIAIAAVRCGTLSARARASICSKARSRM